MHDISEIYKMMHWHSAYGEQLVGIKLAKKLKDISPLIQPISPSTGKPVWENCARALYEISDNRLEQYLPSLLEWIEDLNWPGALIILDRLKVFSGEKLKMPFTDRFNYAVNLNNEEGLMLLDNLSELLDNKELKAELPNGVLETLQKHYHNCGWWYNE